ncbi:hypothetical protein pb186bvf_008300 [Paramecium bursaria]
MDSSLLYEKVQVKTLLGNRYKLTQPLANKYGSVSQCYIAQDQQLYNRDVVIKKMGTYQDQYYKIEMKALEKCTKIQPNIVECYNVFKENDCYYVAMEKCPQNLIDYLDSTRPQNRASIGLQIIRDLCKGISQLKKIYGQYFIHRNIKPNNIFYKDNNFRLSDYQFSKFQIQMDSSKFQKDYPFIAPEVATQIYDDRIDIYSLGVLLFFITTEKYNLDLSLIDQCQERNLNYSQIQCLKQLIQDMTKKDPFYRITWDLLEMHDLVKLAPEVQKQSQPFYCEERQFSKIILCAKKNIDRSDSSQQLKKDLDSTVENSQYSVPSDITKMNRYFVNFMQNLFLKDEIRALLALWLKFIAYQIMHTKLTKEQLEGLQNMYANTQI